MKILVTGGNGMVGSYLQGQRFSHEELDVTDLGSVMRICEEVRPDVIIHAAALVDLAACETDPARAYLVNAGGTYHVALAARAVGAKLIYISTSGIFDGTKSDSYTEEDQPNPVNVYGHSKYLGELAVAGMLENHLIVRTSWVFGGGPTKDRKFVGKIVARKSEPEIHAATDVYGSPTYAKDLARAIERLVVEDRRGIQHVGGGRASRYDIAEVALRAVGSDTRVIPALASDFPAPYTSGANESMIQSAYVRPWREALKEYIETEW